MYSKGTQAVRELQATAAKPHTACGATRKTMMVMMAAAAAAPSAASPDAPPPYLVPSLQQLPDACCCCCCELDRCLFWGRWLPQRFCCCCCKRCQARLHHAGGWCVTPAACRCCGGRCWPAPAFVAGQVPPRYHCPCCLCAQLLQRPLAAHVLRCSRPTNAQRGQRTRADEIELAGGAARV